MDAANPRHRVPRRPMRRWLGMELSAYVLVGIVLATRSWEDGYGSGLVVLLLWLFVGCALVLSMRETYRKRNRGGGSV